MRQLRILFGLGGRIDREDFAGGLATVLFAFWLGVQGSSAALPLMAEWLAPLGINAGFALNAIWSVLGLLFMWCSIALGAKRLRDRGRSPWWIVVVVVPLAALAVLNDQIFLVSRHFTLAREVQIAGAIASALIGLWIIFEGLLLPGRGPEAPRTQAAAAETTQPAGLRDRLAASVPEFGSKRDMSKRSDNAN